MRLPLSKLHGFVIHSFFILFSAIALLVRADAADVFPDGTPISEWFTQAEKVEVSALGTLYSIAEHGAIADGKTLNTEAIQRLIDEVAAKSGGGVIVVPAGTFRTGALFFKPGTHLHLEKGAVLLGSDQIVDYPKQPSRMEGQCLDYFPALVNAYDVDGFTITGTGTIDGNGKTYWETFWKTRKQNKNCTNLEVSRPRLVFIWGSDHVTIQDVKLKDSGFWTTHLYQCNYARLIDLDIRAPRRPVKAASSDGIDLDVCSNVLVRGCYISVCDDGIALKGGKGVFADKDPNNGSNTNVLIEDCEFGFCYALLTCGSESIHNRNILVRNCKVNGTSKVLHMKMRTDTPQLYEFITMENIQGSARGCIQIHPYSQFEDLKGAEKRPVSVAQNIILRNFQLEVDEFANVELSEGDQLKNFRLEDLRIQTKDAAFDPSMFDGLELKSVFLNGKELVDL